MAMRRRARALTDAELVAAESIERLAQRRRNLLHALLAERKRRAGRADKMMPVKVEGRI